MIRLYPEQLRAQLHRRAARGPIYYSVAIRCCCRKVRTRFAKAAATQGFTEHHTATIDASTDWPALFSLSQAMSLFASRQTLLLVLPENGPNAAINEQLATLVQHAP
ncbi:DNA polymerase III subunit delta [Raoultella ornithinolytica]|nr:DNA polymerase III subunit delta [Raoultella ornithinolytica]